MGIRNLLYAAKGAWNILRGKVAPTLYMEEIQAHFDRLMNIKDDESTVFHELASEYVHIDVHLVKPTEERPFYMLFTTGMSDLPMTFEDDEPWDFKKVHERAEIFCLLPPDWKFGSDVPKGQEGRYGWVISAIKTAARYPHMCKTWLSNTHTLQYTEENRPFADNTQLSSVIFIQLNDEDFGGKYGNGFEGFSTSDNTYINLLCMIPIFEDEMNFKLENGGIALFKRLFGDAVSDFSQLVIRPDRESVCFNKLK
ncbi:MAG: suppressor of fused domain protein [Oscillospiraceae bacterium]|nr:suppressor of fused domain protein [Oscillospiraceae bacterium]